MKRAVVATLTLILAIVMMGCSNNLQQSSSNEPNTTATTSANQASAEPEELTIKDSAYSINRFGSVVYTVEIENPNDDYMADYATITVTGKTEDGKISFSDDWVVGGIMPNTVTYWSSQAGSGNATESNTISFDVSVNKSNWSRSDVKVPDNFYEFRNVSVEPTQMSTLHATGEITLTDDTIDFGLNKTDSPMIVCALKDDNGKLVGGFSGYLDKELTAGKPTVFDIDSLSEMQVEYSTVEMYANPW